MRVLPVAFMVMGVAAAACGGDDDDGVLPIDAAVGFDAPNDAPADAPATACGTRGNATVSGTIGGGKSAVSIDPVVRAELFAVGGAGHVILLDEGMAATCGGNANPNDSEHLVLGFCTSPGVGTHVVDTVNFDCPGIAAFALLERGGGDLSVSATGTVNITAVEGGCVTGSFDVTLENANAEIGTFTGSFNAATCP